jgi:hypothetical protein
MGENRVDSTPAEEKEILLFLFCYDEDERQRPKKAVFP